MHRTYVRRRVTLLAGFVVVLALGVPATADALGQGSDLAGQVEAGTPYVIREGDTLWNLAVRIAPAEDPRIVVDRIASANGIEAGDLIPGQQLTIPAA